MAINTKLLMSIKIINDNWYGIMTKTIMDTKILWFDKVMANKINCN